MFWVFMENFLHFLISLFRSGVGTPNTSVFTFQLYESLSTCLIACVSMISLGWFSGSLYECTTIQKLEKNGLILLLYDVQRSNVHIIQFVFVVVLSFYQWPLQSASSDFGNNATAFIHWRYYCGFSVCLALAPILALSLALVQSFHCITKFWVFFFFYRFVLVFWLMKQQ